MFDRNDALDDARDDGRDRDRDLSRGSGGGGSTTDDRERDARDGFTRDLDLPRGRDRERVRDRDRIYDIDGSETRMLATVGSFRVVAVSFLPIVSHTLSAIGGQACSPEWGPPVFGR
jgi:hypothetical protein